MKCHTAILWIIIRNTSLSDVLQEGSFFVTIPIAPKILLEQNSLPGLEYKVVDELSYKKFFQANDEQ